jgi:hypothetical protein
MGDVRSSYFNVGDEEIMSLRTNRNIEEAKIVTDEEELKPKAEKIPYSTALLEKVKKLRTGEFTTATMLSSKYVMKGAMIGFGVFIVAGLYYKKSLLLSGVAGIVIGGFLGNQYNKFEMRNEKK